MGINARSQTLVAQLSFRIRENMFGENSLLENFEWKKGHLRRRAACQGATTAPSYPKYLNLKYLNLN